jgi:type I restriction enzyme S subunit
VSRALRPYPEYKDSGVPWLGEISAHWEVRRQRNIVSMLVSNVDKHTVEGEIPIRLCNYVDVYKHDVITDRIPFMRATASRAEINRFRLQVGDVVITKDSETWDDIGVSALVAYQAPDLVCGYHLAILRPRKNFVYGAFLSRALQSQGVAAQFHVSANGITRFGLSQNAIKSVWVPVPPLPEQQAIARFLDHHDRLTRRYIRAQRRLIELLNEQKQALIQQAVTRGLDPHVKLKPSGVEWLGEIPVHWGAIRVRSLVESIDQGVSPQAEVFLADDNSWGVLKSGCVNGVFFRETEHKRLPNGFEIDPKIVVKVGDVLVSRACGSPKFVGSVGRVESLSYKLILSDKTFRLDFKDHRKVLRSKTDQIDVAIARAQRQIDLVREYRTRLIADVVTGKLDVRGVPLPDLDEAGDPGDLDKLEEDVELDNLDAEEMDYAG